MVLGVGLAACSSSHEDHGAEVPVQASKAVDCAGTPYRQGRGDYEGGLEKVSDDAREAMDSYLDEQGYGLPKTTYDEAARHGDVALFTWSQGGVVLAAFVVRDGMDDVEGHHGWGVTSYAVCDPAEWPPERSDEIGIEVWSNADGDRVPTSLIHSERGPEHCDWQEMTFLFLGSNGEDGEFYGSPPGDLQQFLATRYAAHAELPTDARDTGYQRDGRALWVTPAAAYLVTTDGDAERWPAPSKRPLRCL